MTMFDDRKKAAERNFEREEECAVRIRARRNKLLGVWAAEHMGLFGDAAAHYALDVVEAEVTGHDDEALAKKVCDDLIAAGFPMTGQEVRAQIAVFAAQARAQVMTGAAS